MTVSLVVLNNIGYFSEHLGVASIGAYLKSRGVTVSIQQVDSTPDEDFNSVFTRIMTDFDIMGFYTIYSNAELVLKAIARMKNDNNFLFAGGPTATIAGEYLLADCEELDFVVLGDGERSVYDAIDILHRSSNVRELATLPSVLTRYDTFPKKAAAVNISELPRVLRYYFDGVAFPYLNARVVTCKKCLGNCTFCATIHAYKHDIPDYNAWNCRKIEDVFNEFVAIYETYGIRQFSIIDPSFEDPGSLGKSRLKRLCELLIEYPIKFFVFWVYLRAETFSEADIELIRLMRQAGFLRVLIGIEANNEYDLRLYDKKATVSDNQNVMKLFKSCDIEVIPGFIMMNPFSQVDNLQKNYYFLVDNGINRVGLYIGEIQIFHTTPFYERVKDHDLLSPDFSYSNPYGYVYLDAKLQEISNFIRTELLCLPVMGVADKHIYTNEYVYNTVRALFPEVYSEYEDRIRAINTKISSLLANYFYIIYVELNLVTAKQQLQKFSESLASLFALYDKLTFRMLTNRDIRKYVLSTDPNFR